MHETSTNNDERWIQAGNWEELLCLGAQEVFEMMVGLGLRRCEGGDAKRPGEFTAVIGLAGALTGVFAMGCTTATGLAITRSMLGVEETEAKAEMSDALGEVCNMVIGNFKGKLGKAGEVSALSVPTVIYGRDYRVRSLVHGAFAECWMEADGGAMRFRLDYRLAETAEQTLSRAAGPALFQAAP